MTIARAIRRSFRLLPYFRENLNASFEVSLRNIFDQFHAQIVGGVENLFENGLGTALKMEGFATAVLRGIASLDPAVGFQTVEQTGERRAFDSHPLRDFFLGEFVSALRKMHERSPFSLTQPERSQTLVELRPPGARGAEEHKAEFVDVQWRHNGI